MYFSNHHFHRKLITYIFEILSYAKYFYSLVIHQTLRKSEENCSRDSAIFIFIKSGNCDVINYVNQLRHNNANLDLLNIEQFYRNRPESIQERRSKDRHTDTDIQKCTHRHIYSQVLFQTQITQIYSVNEYDRT